MKNLKNYTEKPVMANETEIENGLKVMVIGQGEVYECYLRKEGYAYEFMFGLLTRDVTIHDAMEIAIGNSHEYLFLFDDKEY